MSTQSMARSARRELVAAGGGFDWARLAVGLASELDALLPNLETVPPALLDHVLGETSPALLVALLSNKNVGHDDDAAARILAAAIRQPTDEVITAVLANEGLSARDEVREWLAGTGHTEVLNATYNRWSIPALWSLRHRRISVAATSAELSYAEREIDALVVSRFPSLVHKAIRHPKLVLTRAERLRAVVSIHRYGGVDALTEIDTGNWEPETAELVRELATTGDTGPIEAAVARAEGTVGAIEELRDPRLCALGFGAFDTNQIETYTEHLGLRDCLDWPMIQAADTQTPFEKNAIAALVSQPGCPKDFRDHLYARQPVIVAEHTPHPDERLLRAACPPRSRGKATRVLAKRGLGGAITPADLFAHGAPAQAVLEVIASIDKGVPGDTLRRLLTEAVAAGPGGDPDAWCQVVARMKSFPGTVSELLACAGGSADWPLNSKPTKIATTLTGGRAALVCLLDAAPDAAHTALLSRLDSVTLRDLFGHGRYRPQWIDALVAEPVVREAARLANLTVPSAVDIERLAALDEPDTNTWLYPQDAATDEQRARIRRGESFQTGSGSTVAHTPEFAELLGDHTNWRIHELGDCVDLEQHRALLRFHYIVGRIPQLRMFLGLWDRFGFGAVTRRLNERPVTYSTYAASRNQLTEMLRTQGPEDARRRLRAEVTEAETAESQIDAWRTRTDLAAFAEETHRWQWEELAAAHAAQPFSPDAIWRLAHIAGSPQVFTQEVAGQLYSKHHRAYRRLNAGDAPEEVLAANPADSADRTQGYWIPTAIAAGRITWPQVLRHAAPASAVLHLVSTADTAERPGRTALTALLDETLGGDAEARLLMWRMLPDFTGTVTELVTSAAAAVRPA